MSSSFLEKILATKREEVAALRQSFHAPGLSEPRTACRGFADAIRRQTTLAVVAEVKKASPSKGLIVEAFDPVAIASTYDASGATAVSVLTDRTYFQGDLAYLTAVRNKVNLPVLRKDFIIDELQLEEARSAGADAVLLICAALSKDRLRTLSGYAKSLGMDVLVEVHDLSELDAALAANPSVLGVNNRNLNTFEVNLETTELILREVPENLLVIAESGVHTRDDAMRMAQSGAKGILVGESLMRAGQQDLVKQMISGFRQPLVQGGATGVTAP